MFVKTDCDAARREKVAGRIKFLFDRVLESRGAAGSSSETSNYSNSSTDLQIFAHLL